MRKNFFLNRYLCFGTFVFCFLFFINPVRSQQLSFKNFVLYSSDKSELSSSTSVSGGAIVSKTLIKTTGNSSLNASLHSGGKIELANSNSVDGIVTAAGNTGTVRSEEHTSE